MNVWKRYRGFVFLALVLAAIFAARLNPRLLEYIGRYRMTHDLDRIIARPYFYLGRLPITLAFLFKAILYLLLLAFFSRFVRRVMQRRVLPRTSLEPGQQYAIARGIDYAIFLVGLMVGLQSAGVNLNSLLVVGGTLGIGLGFGLQNIANNFVSGLILLAEQPIRVGDRVEVGGTSGDVVRIGGRSTWVRTNENVVMIVPNSEFVSNRVTNWTLNDPRARFSVPVGVGYGSDPEKVRTILLEVAHRHADVLSTPAADVLCTGIGNNALNFELRVWSTKQVHTPNVLRSDLYFAILRAFREHGIELPPAA
jgi:small-conductance mechanosensitive channel